MSKRHKENKRIQHKWSLAVKDRDQWRCTECRTETGRLEAHHLETYEDDLKHWDIANGQTLCRDCHIRLHRKRFVQSLDHDSRAWETYIDKLRGRKK